MNRRIREFILGVMVAVFAAFACFGAVPVSPDPARALTIDPINTQNGNVTLSETDVVIPCPGLSLAFL
jgi:hypothetical protein